MIYGKFLQSTDYENICSKYRAFKGLKEIYGFVTEAIRISLDVEYIEAVDGRILSRAQIERAFNCPKYESINLQSNHSCYSKMVIFR